MFSGVLSAPKVSANVRAPSSASRTLSPAVAGRIVTGASDIALKPCLRAWCDRGLVQTWPNPIVAWCDGGPGRPRAGDQARRAPALARAGVGLPDPGDQLRVD